MVTGVIITWRRGLVCTSFLVAVSGIDCSVDIIQAQMLWVSMSLVTGDANCPCLTVTGDPNYTFAGKHDHLVPHFASAPPSRHFIPYSTEHRWLLILLFGESWPFWKIYHNCFGSGGKHLCSWRKLDSYPFDCIPISQEICLVFMNVFSSFLLRKTSAEWLFICFLTRAVRDGWKGGRSYKTRRQKEISCL